MDRAHSSSELQEVVVSKAPNCFKLVNAVETKVYDKVNDESLRISATVPPEHYNQVSPLINEAD